MTDDSLGLIKNCIASTEHGSIHRRYISLWKEADEKGKSAEERLPWHIIKNVQILVSLLGLVFSKSA